MLLLLLAFPGINNYLLFAGLSLKIDSNAYLRPLHPLKPFAEVLFGYSLDICTVSLISVLPSMQLARDM
jgi:hypothetical protein